jgi:hypothetical protein
MILGWEISDGDSLEVREDGSWTALVTTGTDRAGQFGGRISAERMAKIRDQVDAAVAEGFPERDPDQPWRAGAAAETIWAGDVVGQIEMVYATWPPVWQTLATTIASIMDKAPEHARAALELDASGNGEIAHVGTEPLVTDGSELAVEAYESEADAGVGKTWSSTIPSPGDGKIPVGWRAALGLSNAKLTAPRGGTVEVSVSFVLVEQGLPRNVSVSASRIDEKGASR